MPMTRLQQHRWQEEREQRSPSMIRDSKRRHVRGRERGERVRGEGGEREREGGE